MILSHAEVLKLGFSSKTYIGENGEIDYYEKKDFILDIEFQPLEYGSEIRLLKENIETIEDLFRIMELQKIIL